MCQEHTLLISCHPQDFRVWQSFKTAVTQMHSIVAKCGEESRRARWDPHVGQEPHTGARSTG